MFFGAYEQDNDHSNGKEAIEWLVLEVKDRQALVISKYALDNEPYNTTETEVTWETCTLRKWLNNTFLNSAFSADEKAMIPTVTVSADNHPYYDTNPGNKTQDQVFLLNITEANKYFKSDSTRRCIPTDYAVIGKRDICHWWLRTPGFNQLYASHVEHGTISLGKTGPIRIKYAVRPAMWIDLNS